MVVYGLLQTYSYVICHCGQAIPPSKLSFTAATWPFLITNATNGNLYTLYHIVVSLVGCSYQRDLDGNVPHAKERVQWDPMLIPKVATFQSNVIVSQQDFVLIFLDRFFQSKAISVQQNHQLSGCGEDLIAYLIN